MQWTRITTMRSLPEKPGKNSYEQIDCLIWHKDEPKFRVWNCEHFVWDDASGDDYFCDPLEPTHYMIIEPPSETAE